MPDLNIELLRREVDQLAQSADDANMKREEADAKWNELTTLQEEVTIADAKATAAAELRDSQITRLKELLDGTDGEDPTPNEEANRGNAPVPPEAKPPSMNQPPAKPQQPQPQTNPQQPGPGKKSQQ